MAKVTAGDVARAAGVSAATVSKVFNGRADVAPTTRSLVRRTARQLGYELRRRPGLAADATRVAVVVEDLENAYTPAVLEGLVREAQREGVVVELHERDGGRVRGPAGEPGSIQWLQVLRDSGVDGVILVTMPVDAAHVRAAEELGLPLISLDPVDEGADTPVSVGATNWRGGVQATRHLLSLGHRRIGVVTGPPRSRPAMERLAGFQSAMRDAGVDIDPALIVAGGFRYEDGLSGGASLLQRSDRPTAIFASCDLVAFGVAEAGRRLGLRVPHDLSLVGFDDGYMALWHSPPLTTVRQPLDQLGAEALRRISRLIAGEPAPPELELATTLVVRQSTAAPPA